MIDERKEAQASLYVLGALPPDEVREFEATLRGDPQLQGLVAELRGTAGAMVAAYPRVTPPPALKERILAAIDRLEAPAGRVLTPDPDRAVSWMFWVPWALAACFAILCVVLITVGRTLRQQAVQLSERLGAETDEAAALREQLAQTENRAALMVTNYQTRIAEIQKQVLQRVEEINRQSSALTNQLQRQYADTKRALADSHDQLGRLAREKKTLEEALAGVTAGDSDHLSNTRLGVLRPTTAGSPGAVGATSWSGQEQRGLLVLESLPALPPTQTYQLWLFDPKLAIPVSGGVFPANAAGSVRLQFAPQIRMDSAERFAISIEPAGGSATPTPGRIVMTSN